MLAVWSPWQNWNLSFTNLLGIESKEEYSALKVKSLAGEIDVFLDGEYKDSASSESDFLEIFPVSPGEHTVLLTRRDADDYAQIVRKINFEPAVDVIVGFEIGPTEDFSEGHILYATKSYTSEGNPVAEIFSLPEMVKVSLDDKYIGETPLKEIPLDIGSKHKLKFEKEGYDSLEIEILPDTQEARDKLKNMVLNLEITLFARPIKIVTQ